METLAFVRCGSRSGTGSRFVLGGILALLVILGILAMHSVHLGGGSPSQSSTAHAPATQGEGTATVAVAGTEISGGAAAHGAVSGDSLSHESGAASTAAPSCANCATDELSMAANCLAAVVLGFLLLLPRLRQGVLLRLLRAGPRPPGAGLPLPRTPSLNVLCINRC